MRPVKLRIFTALHKDMGTVHSVLLLYSEAIWLSCSKVLQRVYELRDDFAISKKGKQTGSRGVLRFICDEIELIGRHI